MEHVGMWVGIGSLALGMIVWVARISWVLRGVSDVANTALKTAGNATPRAECVLKEKGQHSILERIDKNVGAIWAKIETLKIGERLTRVETEISVIKKRMNGNNG